MTDSVVIDARPQPGQADRSSPAAARDARRLRRHLAAAVALAASLALYVAILRLFLATGDQDAALHAIYARFPTTAIRVLTPFARPLFAVLYLPLGPLGYEAMRVFTVAICAATAWTTYLVARKIALPRPWLAIPLTLVQPVMANVGTEAMTEPTFALLLALGLLAWVHERTLLAAALWSFLPLVRPEGPIILAVVGLVLLPAALKDRTRLLAIALLGLGLVVWEVACVVVTGNPRFLLDEFPWSSGSSAWSGPAHHYVARWPIIIGWGALLLWLLGLWRALRQPALRLSLLFTIAVLVVHSALYALAMMDSTGFDRYFASVAPLVALVATAGAGVLARVAGWAFPPVAAALLLVQAVQAFVSVDSNPNNHMPPATLETIRQARQRLDIDVRPILSADNFGYVFLDVDKFDSLKAGPRERTAPMIDSLPRGTVVLWDNITGEWWYHLSVDDFTARGFRLLWERRFDLHSPRIGVYRRFVSNELQPYFMLFGQWPFRPYRQAVLVRE